MRVVALLTVRNEERYLARCLEHLYSQVIETCLIDNGSTDSTLEIAESFLGRGLFRIEHFPFNGCFEFPKILLKKQELAWEIDADWFIHHDADEIREAPSPYKTLKEGIEDADLQGYNAINFDEFVFLPTSEDESFEGKDYVREMQYYYFFEPHPLRQVKAWKKTANIDLHSSGGHRIEFAGKKIFPVSFILRHYIVLSKSHALEKYGNRVYSKAALEKGWSLERAAFAPNWLNFPAKSRLKRLNGSGNTWDKSEPWVNHEFLAGNSQANFQPQYLQIKTKTQLSEQLSESQDGSSEPPMPIIVGNPRSGTTLLRLMLDAHPDLAIPPETHFIPALFQLEGDRHQLRESFYKTLTAAPTWPDCQLSADNFYTHLVNIEPFTISGGLRCFYQMYAKRLGKSRWGDQTPPYVLRMQDIQTVLPEAHFIHIIRDGRDVALSMKGMWWGAGDDMEKQASNWIWRIREGRQQAQFCQHYLEVRYEELITNTTKVLQDICAFINLPYHSQMEDYYKSAESRLNEFNPIYRSDGTLLSTKEQHLSIHSLTSQPPDKSRIGRWKREMSNEDRDKYEAIAGAMLRDLGYDTKKREEEKPMSNLEKIHADLERSQLRLAEIRANLKPIEPISEISRYMEDFEKINGWFHRNYVSVYSCINYYQKKHGIRGNLAEIGVYHGKSFIPLCCLCNSGELALAVDIFGSENSTNKPIIGDLNIFSYNVSKYLHSKLDYIKILQVNSENCTPQDYLNTVHGKKMRIFSVDGCHTSEATEIDLRNAYNCLVEGGVIILDDYFSARTPGVSEGFHRFLLKDNPDLKAFFIGWNKMLLTHSSHAEGYMSALKEALSSVRQAQFLGSPVLIVSPPQVNWIS